MSGTISANNLILNNGNFALTVNNPSPGSETSILYKNGSDVNTSWYVGHNVGGISSGNFGFYNSARGTVVTILGTNGNVGVGTKQPQYTFDVTTGTINASSYTGGNVQLSGTVSAATHVGTLVSAGSIGVAGATVGTLYANSITSANIYVSGSVVSVNVTSVNVIDTNITSGTLNVSTGITTGTLLATSGVSIRTSGILEFGYGVVGKEVSAGKMGYGVFTTDVLDIVGAGNSAGSRTVKIWEHLVVGTSITTGVLNANTGITTASLGAGGITVGTLYAGTVTASNIGAPTISSGTLYASTIVSTANLNATTITVGTLYTGTISTANIASSNNLNITSSNLNINSSNFNVTATNSMFTGNVSAGNIQISGTISAANHVGTIVSANSIIASTSSTIANLNITGQSQLNSKILNTRSVGDNNHGLGHASTNTLVNVDGPILWGNVGGALGYQNGSGTSGILSSLTWNSSGISSSNIQLSGTVSTNNLRSTNVTLGSLVVGNITSGNISAGNIIANNYAQMNWNSTMSGIGNYIASTTYYKIATLPATSDVGGSGAITIKGTLGGYGYVNCGTIDVSIATRDGYDIQGTFFGNAIDISQCDIVVYMESNNTYSIYIKTNSWFKFDLIVGGYGVGVILFAPNTTGVTTLTGSVQTTSVVSSLKMYNVNGNVGINTSTPAYKLDVGGVINASSGYTGASVSIAGTISAATVVGTLLSAGSIGVGGITTGTLYARNITSASLIITNNIGMNGNKPGSNTLIDFGSTVQKNMIGLYNDNTTSFYGFGITSGTLMYQAGGSTHNFYVNSTPFSSNYGMLKMQIDNDYVNIFGDCTGGNSWGILRYGYYGTTQNNLTLTTQDATTNYLRMMANGNAGIVNTGNSSYIPQYTWDVQGTLNSSSIISATTRVTSANINALNATLGSLVLNAINLSTGSTYSYLAKTGINTAGSSSAAGNVFSLIATGRIAATEFDATSDQRVKTNISNLDIIQCDKILNLLEPKTYTYIDNIHESRTRYGLIAQEVKEILPELINYKSDYIPNMMCKAEFIDKNKFKLKKNSDPETCIKQGIKNLNISDNVRIHHSTSEMDEDTLDCQIICKEENDTHTIYTIDKDVLKNNIFIYGIRIDDFHVLNYDQIIPILISGYKYQNDRLKSNYNTLLKRIELLESKLS